MEKANLIEDELISALIDSNDIGLIISFANAKEDLAFKMKLGLAINTTKNVYWMLSFAKNVVDVPADIFTDNIIDYGNSYVIYEFATLKGTPTGKLLQALDSKNETIDLEQFTEQIDNKVYDPNKAEQKDEQKKEKIRLFEFAFQEENGNKTISEILNEFNQLDLDKNSPKRK